MMACTRDCFASHDGVCVALESGYEDDKPCPFQKKIARMSKLYGIDENFRFYVDKYMEREHVIKSYALIVKIIVDYGESIIEDKKYSI